MKSFLRTISFVSLLSVPTLAFGQSPTDMSNFSFRLKLQTRFDLTDSYRTNQGDIFGTTARTGLNYNYKNVFGIIEFQGGSATDATTSSSSSTTNGQQELFVVRRAHVGLDIFNTEMGKISFVIGRDHNTASIVYAPDAFANLIATNIDNMSASNSQDGIALRYAGKFGFGDVKAQIGYYNNFPVTILSGGGTGATSQTNPFGTSSKGVGDATYNSQSKSGSRAFAGQIGVNANAGDGVVEARAFYSMQANAVTKTSATVSSNEAADLSNVEASLGYNYKGGMLKGGLWAQSFSVGRTQTANGTITSNSITYVDGATDDSFTATVVGLGVTGTSDLFGLNNLITSGDKLTYGLGYQMVQGHNFTNSGASSVGVTAFTNQVSALNFYNIAAGYAQGAYSLELNYVGVNSDRPIYADKDGSLNKDSAYLIYLVATIVL
ncbi:hypothetical protein [Fluviispira vulneris]|uniref:hypothetical protein n=1 Tax=Fluviispira vulneris TaxID=2763012 RepID=UPI001648ABB2|nr:hypothetical protein [Fluviispira vulneris]